MIEHLIYFFTLTAGLAAVVYGYLHWKKLHDQEAYRWIAIGSVAIFVVIFDYCTKYFLSPDLANSSILHWSRLFLDIIVVIAALSLKVPKGWK